MTTTEAMPVYIGVDISKCELVADLSSSQTPATFAQTAEGHAALLCALPAGAHIVCEASGGYERAFIAALHQAGVPVSLVQPARVRHLARAHGLLAKTDRIDARVLSSFGRSCRPRLTPAPSATRQSLRTLVRARQALCEREDFERNQREHLGAADAAVLQTQAAARDELLARQRGELEAAIRALLAADDSLAQAAARLRAVRGVGEVTVWTVLAELPELGRLASGQAAALAGLAPYADESGPRHGPRHICGGRAHVRRVLYMAAIAATQHNRILAEFYRRLRNAGKPAKLALTAVMRKLVELLNRLLKDPNFVLAH